MNGPFLYDEVSWDDQPHKHNSQYQHHKNKQYVSFSLDQLSIHQMEAQYTWLTSLVELLCCLVSVYLYSGERKE